MFEVRGRDGLARLGTLTLPHGGLLTPALLPVVNPHHNIIPPADLDKRFGVQAIITNAYILRRGPRAEEALQRGLRDLLGFPGIVMTDSGAFQSHVYGGVAVANDEIVGYQRDVGSDIGTVLDLFSEPSHGGARLRVDVEETLRRTEEAARLKGSMALAGAVQGGLDLKLREECARRLSALDVDIQAIGGVVPLLEGYRFRELMEVVMASHRGLRPDRPVHLFGAGHPMVFPLAALLGCDLFDSASYGKFAADGRLLFPDGTRRVEELITLPCTCPTCASTTVEGMRASEHLRAEHNLWVSLGEIRRVRQAIHEGSLWELVEERCRVHPELLDALRGLRRHVEYLEEYEDLSRRTFFYTGPESLHRPAAHRLRQRVLERHRRRAPFLVVLPEAPKPYRRTYAQVMARVLGTAPADFVVRSPLGPVPMALEGIYPAAQAFLPADLDAEAQEAAGAFLQTFVRGAGYEFGVVWSGEDAFVELAARSKGPGSPPNDIDVLQAIADYQFGPGAGEALLAGRIDFVRSKATGRVRNIHVDDIHVASLRPGDGFLALRIGGGQRLHRSMSQPHLRVVVDDDSAEFNRQGKNVFAKFVTAWDPALRAGDEVLVVDRRDELVAVGRALLAPAEALAFKIGMAVKVREGVGGPAEAPAS